MSVSGTDSVNGEVPGTPVKRQQSETEQQVSWSCGSLGAGWSRAGRRCESTPRTQCWGCRALGDRTPSLLCPELFVKSPSTRSLQRLDLRGDEEGGLLRRQCGVVEIVANQRSHGPSIGLPCPHGGRHLAWLYLCQKKKGGVVQEFLHVKSPQTFTCWQLGKNPFKNHSGQMTHDLVITSRLTVI